MIGIVLNLLEAILNLLCICESGQVCTKEFPQDRVPDYLSGQISHSMYSLSSEYKMFDLISNADEVGSKCKVCWYNLGILYLWY